MGQLRLTASSTRLAGRVQRRWPRTLPAPPAAGRSHFLYKAADAVLTSTLRPRRGLAASLRTLFGPQSANYERTAALVQAVDCVQPGFARRLSRTLLRKNALPLAYDDLALLGYGSGSTVFLLLRGEQRLVLKIYRRSLGRSSQGLAAVAAYFSQKYETVARWYGGSLTLVPPAAFLTLHGPLLGLPAVGVIQPYIGGEKRDLFEDFTAGELLSLLRAHPRLCQQFRCFVRRTRDAYTREGRCLDIVGRHNVLVSIEGDGECSMWIIDNGIFDLVELKEKEPDTYSLVLQRLDYLHVVYEKSLAFSKDIGPS